MSVAIEHGCPSCGDGKVCYTSHARAKQAARRRNRRNRRDWPYDAYVCPHGHGFHVGHAVGFTRGRRRRT